MRSRIKRLERAAEEHYITIPQQNGTRAKFPPAAYKEAFLTSVARLKGEDVPEHPLSTAAANSPDSEWRGSFVAGTHTVTGGEIPEDLSE